MSLNRPLPKFVYREHRSTNLALKALRQQNTEYKRMDSYVREALVPSEGSIQCA